MKILLLTSTFKSYSDKKIPTFVLDQTLSIAENEKLEYVVLAPHDSKLETKSEKINKNIDVKYFHYFFPRFLETLNYAGLWPSIAHQPLKALLLPFLLLFFTYNAIKIAKAHKPDLIYAHWFTPQGIIAYITSLATSIPFGYTSHSSDVWIQRKLGFIGDWIVKSSTKKASAISVVSRRTLSKLKYFFSETEWQDVQGKVSIIPMGVYPVILNPPSPKSEQKSNKDIVFIGRIAEKKGLQYLIPAFDSFASQHPGYRLKIAGTGPFEPQLSSLISKAQNQNKIDLLGHVEGIEKLNLLEHAFCLVVPSIITDSGDAEGLPVSLLEGLSFGKPCIATKESGADDIVTDKLNGCIIDQKNEKDIIGALDWIADLDEKTRLQLSNEARKTSENYHWKNIARKYQNFLRKIANDSGIDIK